MERKQIKNLAHALDEQLPELLHRRGVVGLSAALFTDAGLIWSRGFGFGNTATAERVQPDTVFEGASFSKPATAYVALKMCERGVLELDRPLAAYLPTPFIPDEPRLGEITLRMVLSHSSGMSHDDPPRLLHTPGTKFFYSATGYEYVQRVIERLSGLPFAECMRQNLLLPCGMRHSSFIWDGTSNLPCALGHAAGKPEEKWISSESSAAGTLHTTPTDFAGFMIALLRPDPHNTFQISEETVVAALKPQISVKQSLSWNLGWGVHHDTGHDAICHWGWWHDFRNFTIADRESGWGIILMSNSENGMNLCTDVIESTIGKPHPAFAWIDSLP